MRLRLVHKLSLLMLSLALLAVLALGGLTAWNLRHGFGEYLQARDVARLEDFRDLVEKKISGRDPHAEPLKDLSMHALHNEFRGPVIEAPPPHRPQDGFFGGPPPPGQNPNAWPQRVAILGLQGQTLMGREPHTSGAGHVDRPVRIGEQPVAWVRLYLSDTIGAGDSRFLYQQYAVIAGTSVGLVLLALFGAAWLARRWVKPLEAVAMTTRKLAQGELTARLATRSDGTAGTDEIGDVVLHVNRMAESLQTLEQSRRLWLADISHELRTPLTVMQGDIEALCDGVRPLNLEAVQVLRKDVYQLGRIVNDLHLLAVADLQALPCDFQSFDPADWLGRLLGRYALRAQSQGLALQLTLGRELAEVCWDASRMEQLLGNLLENSIRYTQAPGRIELSLGCVQDRLLLEVSDTAPGVPAPDLDRVLEPLYRSDAARSRALGGTGLGLAIAQAIAKAHGGHIDARPSRLGGLCVRVDLPRQVNDQPMPKGRFA